ncbi:nucleotidyltransferase domain-containing protein [archaeon]|nr:nucleotidyltransferase domain-containing protein [archaeon]
MVNIYKLKLTNLQREIIKILMIYSGKALNQRKIANLLQVSSPAVMKSLPYLKKEDLIIMEQDKDSKRWSIELNREEDKIMQLKRVENLKQIYESGLNEYLMKEFAGATIILFGSYSRGEDIMNSDIDIAIIGRKDKKIILSKFEIILKRKIFLNFYDSFSKIHKNLKENLFNGIILSGSIEL